MLSGRFDSSKSLFFFKNHFLVAPAQPAGLRQRLSGGFFFIKSATSQREKVIVCY
jgi:hypothetical protein